MAEYRETVRVGIQDDTGGPLRSIGSALRTLTSPRAIAVTVRDAATAPLRLMSRAATGLAGSLGEVAKTAAGFVLGQALTDLPGYLLAGAKAAAEDTASTLRLQRAVENTGVSWDSYSGSINDAIVSGQNLGFSDDEVRDSLSLLAAQTGNVEESQKRMSLAQDLARGTGMSLVTASRLLGKVTDENVNVLARYGIRVKKGSDATELFAKVTEKFGGQAQTFAKSTAGQMEILTIQIGELQEQIGYFLLPVLGKLVSFATTWLLPTLANKIVPAFAAWAAVMTEKVLPSLQRLRAVAQPALAAVQGRMQAVTPMAQQIGTALRLAITADLSPRTLGKVLATQLGEAFQAAAIQADVIGPATLLATRIGGAMQSAMQKAPGIQGAAEDAATRYVDAFGKRVAAAPPITVPGTEKTIGGAGVGGAISGAAEPTGKFAVAFAELMPFLITGAAVLPSVAAGLTALSTAIALAGSAAAAAGISVGAFLLPLLVIAAVVAALYVAWTTDFMGIQEIAAGALGTISAFITGTVVPAIQSLVAWVGEKAPVAWAAIQSAIQSVWEVVQTFLPSWSDIQPAVDQLSASITEMVATVWPSLQEAFSALGPLVEQVGGLLLDIGRTALPLVKDAAVLLAPVVKFVLTEAFTGLLGAITLIVDVLKVALPAALSGIQSLIEGATATVRLFRDVWQDVVRAIKDVIALAPSIPSISAPSIPGLSADLIPRQHGGPVLPGRQYLVGERGPEVLQVGSPGHVGGGGGGGATVHITLNYAGAPSRADAQRMTRMVLEEAVLELKRRRVNVLAAV